MGAAQSIIKETDMNFISTRRVLGGAFAAAALTACGGGSSGAGGTPTPTPTPSSGTLAVALTDAPACGFDAVNVTVTKVRVHQNVNAADTDSGWTDITLATPRKINLLNLTNGVLDALGTATLAPGKYTQVRLLLDPNTGAGMANTVVPTAVPGFPASGNEQSLETPSAVQTGIKIVTDVDVVAGQRSDLVLDFDACKSVVTRGNGKYALKPVVKAVPAALNGISGFISATILGSRVAVSAQQNGAIIAATAPNPNTGEFVLPRLAPGSYDVVITADGRATAVVSSVPVATAASTTAVSTASTPIALAVSQTGSISGSASLAGVVVTEAAYVSAKQTFAGGPTVTVKYKGADLLTGAYTLSDLPLAPPQLARYSSALPLAFSAATSTTPGTGKYRVDAAATGYTAKSIASVDITTFNQTNVNFALVP